LLLSILDTLAQNLQRMNQELWAQLCGALVFLQKRQCVCVCVCVCVKRGNLLFWFFTLGRKSCKIPSKFLTKHYY
jgi:hypothetical protein